MLRDGTIEFAVRMATGLARKQATTAAQRAQRRDPFMPPYDDGLFVADISPTHVCLLNKFPALAHHLVVITRAFEAQETPLSSADFAALWWLCSEMGGLGFYNSHRQSGASQPHKHVQWVPGPLARGPAVAPVETAILGALAQGGPAADDGVSLAHAAELPFAHIAADIGSLSSAAPAHRAEATLAVYRRMRSALGMAQEDTERAYNLLMTSRWMLMIERISPAWGPIALNALGFAGALLVRSQAEFELLAEAGPRAALAAVAAPAHL